MIRRSRASGTPPAAYQVTSQSGFGLSESEEVQSILSDICVVANTDVKVICSITTRILKKSICYCIKGGIRTFQMIMWKI